MLQCEVAFIPFRPNGSFLNPDAQHCETSGNAFETDQADQARKSMREVNSYLTTYLIMTR